MKRSDFLIKSFTLLVIITTISLVPTPGFITLTIPDDESGSQTLAIFDSPHVSKRATSDSPLQIDAIVDSHTLAAAITSENDVLLALSPHAPTGASYYFNIRAPPSAAHLTV